MPKDLLNKKTPQNPGNRPPKGLSVWKYIFWFILIWVVISTLNQVFVAPEDASISYSEFKNQVRADNIGSVTLKANKIKGEFRRAYSTVSARGDTLSYQRFTTIKPAIEDPDFITLLEDHAVTINAESQDSNWWPYVLILAAPWLLLIGYSIYAGKRMQGEMRGFMGGGLFSVGKSRAKKYRESPSNVTFNDVAGLENAKEDLREIVDYLKTPGKFTTLGARIPKGVLFMGPPGTGKTLLARATAGEAEVPFYSISGSEFIEMFVGVGASRVRDMFKTAKDDAPTIIFIDELDSVGRARGTGLGGGHDEREQTLNQILSEMDGFEPHESVVVIAATNRPDVLDPALTRPGRFDRQIVLDMPQKKARKEILTIHSRHVPLAPDVDFDNLAARTVGLSGADLKNLVNEAALLAGRKNKKVVEADDFDQARDKVLLGEKREEVMDDEERRLVAYHEAGHALLAKLLPETDPLEKVTIIPHGQALGATEQTPEKDIHNYSRTYLLGRITVALGGRTAEKMVFNDVTNGSASDLKVVTQLARKMVCQWGMSDRIGPMTYRQGEEHMFLGREIAQPRDFSEETAGIIDEEVKRIITTMEERSCRLLSANRPMLDSIAEALLEQETLRNSDIDHIIEESGGISDGSDINTCKTASFNGR